jgi:uncharacterized membrane protein
MLMHRSNHQEQLAQTVLETTQTTAKRIVNGWIFTLLVVFIALRLTAYLSLYGCLGVLLLLVPGFALYKSWKPWIRYIFTGE